MQKRVLTRGDLNSVRASGVKRLDPKSMKNNGQKPLKAAKKAFVLHTFGVQVATDGDLFFARPGTESIRGSSRPGLKILVVKAFVSFCIRPNLGINSWQLLST